MLTIRASVLICIAACGKPSATPKDSEVPSDQGTDSTPDAGPPPCPNPVSGTTVVLRKITPTNVLGIATLATSPPGDPRLFVLEAQGRIRIFKNEVLQPAPFIDLTPASGGPVASGNELGLLGLAFHPQYATNRTFFIYYTTGGTTAAPLRDVIARCTASATDPDVADRTTCMEIWSVLDPAPNHNGGMMEFGSDGYLYISTGDGGGNFNLPRSQDPTLTFGKMLRIDVDHPANGKPYGIPADNPYAAGGGAPEIYMRGLRNPWRWSFDSITGDMWIGDVGGALIEELDVLAPSEQRGANLGWSVFEGSLCSSPPACDSTGMIFPKDERTHTNGWAAIIGGQVYRGGCYPDLYGWYFYADDQLGALAKARLKPDRTLEIVDLDGAYPHRPASLHADSRGELYMTDVSGYVYHLEAHP